MMTARCQWHARLTRRRSRRVSSWQCRRPPRTKKWTLVRHIFYFVLFWVIFHPFCVVFCVIFCFLTRFFRDVYVDGGRRCFAADDIRAARVAHSVPELRRGGHGGVNSHRRFGRPARRAPLSKCAAAFLSYLTLILCRFLCFFVTFFSGRSANSRRNLVHKRPRPSPQHFRQPHCHRLSSPKRRARQA